MELGAYRENNNLLAVLQNPLPDKDGRIVTLVW